MVGEIAVDARVAAGLQPHMQQGPDRGRTGGHAVVEAPCIDGPQFLLVEQDLDHFGTLVGHVAAGSSDAPHGHS